MPVFPARQPYRHYPWLPEEGEGGALATEPVERKAIAYYPAQDRREPVSADYVARNVSELYLLVKDPTVLGSQDEVEIGGRRFEVVTDGDGDWRDGPWPKYSRLFGGQVLLRRVG